MTNVSQTGYGVDVSVARADGLEKRLLPVVQSGDTVLDVGCGAGGAAARLAAAKATVTGIDIHDFSMEWSDGRGVFMQVDVRDMNEVLEERMFDYCLCNRVLHYVPYGSAAQILQDLHRRVRKKLFISFSGITSELGKAGSYAACHEPIHARFTPLALDAQQTFGITAPLTLYSEQEVLALLSDTGWQVIWSRTTDFGNVLVEARI